MVSKVVKPVSCQNTFVEMDFLSIKKLDKLFV